MELQSSPLTTTTTTTPSVAHSGGTKVFIMKVALVIGTSGLIGCLTGSLINVRVDSGNKQYEFALHKTAQQPTANLLLQETSPSPMKAATHICLTPMYNDSLFEFSVRGPLPASLFQNMAFVFSPDVYLNITSADELCHTISVFEKCINSNSSICTLNSSFNFSVSTVVKIHSIVSQIVTCK
jgi:hypothetical protein